jgi:hypothetical protein
MLLRRRRGDERGEDPEHDAGQDDTHT